MTPALMQTKPRCQRCQMELPDGAPGQRCPRCLFELGLEEAFTKGEEPLPPGPRRFGEYELLEEIARGGMGVVFKARQVKLNRIVALKLILSGEFATKQEVLRFRSEAEAAANLRHPHIVAIHETGEHAGQHYFSMEYVEGRDLASIAREGPLPGRRAARYTESIADAIQHAHEHGTLHRDLKPSNVLIDTDDQPRVTDFGLAKRLRGNFGFTITGQALGSPNYMPPEQTSGKSAALSPACDIYGIGAVLYHLLTGRPPFQAATVEEVIRALHGKEIVAPRLLNGSIPRDLETICLKCLEKNPAKRYSTAQELADELRRFLRSEPIHARPVSRTERAWRWCRRQPAVAALSAAVTIAIFVGIAGMAWQGRARARDLMQTRRLLYASDMSVGQQTWTSANTEVMREILKQHEPKPGGEDLRGFEWRLLNGWQRNDDRTVLFPHEGANGISYSSDGKFIATLSQFSGLTGILRIWHADDPQPSVPVAQFTNVLGMSFAPGNHVVAFSIKGEGLHLWDAALKKPLARLERIPTTRHVKFSADGSKLAVSDSTGAVSIWRMPAGELEVSARNLKATRSLAFSFDGRYVAGNDSKGLRLWDLNSDLVHQDIHCEPVEQLRTCEFSPDGRTLAVMMDHEIRFWSVEDRQLQFSLQGDNRCVVAAFARDGSEMISSGWAGAYLWNLKTRSSTSASRAHKNEVGGVAFAPDGRHVAMATPRGVWVENLNSSETFERVAAGSAIKRLSFAPDSQWLAVGTLTGLTLQNVETGLERILLERHPSSTYALAFSSDGKLLASGSDDNLVRLWDVTTGTNQATLFGHSHWVRAAAFSPDSHWLATSQDADSSVRIWDMLKEKKGIALPLKGGARTLNFSPDGKYLAVGSRSGGVSIFAVGSWELATEHKEHTRFGSGVVTIHSLVFLDSGRTVATADNSGWIVFWDMEKRRVLRSWQAHSSGIRTLALSHDGRTLASGGYDEELILWHVATGRAMLRLKHPAPIFSAAFANDDSILASGGDDKVIHLWRAPSSEILSQGNSARTR